MHWPADPAALVTLQELIAAEDPPTWKPESRPRVGGCFVCFGRGGTGPGSAGDPGWAAALAVSGGDPAIVEGLAGAPYSRGLLAAREGALLEAALLALDDPPEVLLVNATGHDHPRRAGLAVHLGWAIGVPTIGVTHRTLVARGALPGPDPGDREPLRIGAEQVGWWLRTAPNARPLAVTAGWRTDPETAAAVVAEAAGDARTPEPIRWARRAARTARSRAGLSR